MHGRYPRSIIVTICVVMALAIAATFGAGKRDAERGHDFRAKARAAPAAPAAQPERGAWRL